jgi:hypothetical protein
MIRNNFLPHLSFIFLVRPLQGGLHGFYVI